MIALTAFLSAIQQNVSRIHAYRLGGDGSDGTCDCIGLIIGALGLAGFRWPGVHGCNWAARNAMETFGYIASVSECFPGEIVYKAREPGAEKYDLPSAYDNSPDQRDYYHVGVVTSINPLCITHCTGVQGGIKRDNTLGQWRWGGKLKMVSYEGEGESAMEKNPMYMATVHAENGYPVRMRAQPTTSSPVLARVPLGSTVEVLEEADAAWARIRYAGLEGWMMRSFLVPIAAQEEETENVMVPKPVLRQVTQWLSQALEALKNAQEGGEKQ